MLDITATDASLASECGPFTGNKAFAVVIDKATQTLTFNAQLPATQTYVNGATFPVNPGATGGGSTFWSQPAYSAGRPPFAEAV